MADQTPPDLQDRLDQFSQRGKSKRRGNSLGVGALAAALALGGAGVAYFLATGLQEGDSTLEAALQTLVEARLNVLISGGTLTGKTTFARHLLTHVSGHERLITIEDAFELCPGQPNTVALLADRSAGSQRSANALLQASLRMRSDRIIVGEVREYIRKSIDVIVQLGRAEGKRGITEFHLPAKLPRDL